MVDSIAKDLINSLRRIYCEKDAYFIHEPSFGSEESACITECLKEGWVSSASSWGKKLEDSICSYTGSKYSIVTINGTSALHCALLALGIKPQDEVIVPAISFVATANAVSYTGAVPHFVDTDKISLGIDPEKLDKYLSETTVPNKQGVLNKSTGRTIKALVVVHVFGHPANISELAKICGKYNLIFVEDAAESLGSFYNGTHTGCFGKVSILSFNGNKIITTGGGGAVLTQDQQLAADIRHLSTTAKTQHAWEYSHDRIGYNYRMPGINAALGYAQMQKLEEFIRRKRSLAQKIIQEFKNHPKIEVLVEPVNTRSNYWLLTVKLNISSLVERNSILEALHSSKIFARPVWNLLPQLPMYQNSPCMQLDSAVEIEKTFINLPSSAFLFE